MQRKLFIIFIFKLGMNFSINQFKVAVQVYLGSKLLDGHFNLLFNITENLCEAAEAAKKTNLATVVRPLWTEYTNVPFGCPFEPVSTLFLLLFSHIFLLLHQCSILIHLLLHQQQKKNYHVHLADSIFMISHTNSLKSIFQHD